MRSALDHPLFLFEEEQEGTSGYPLEYVRLYKPCFFLSSWVEGFFYRLRLLQLGLNPFLFTFVYTTDSLKRKKIDVLLSFDAKPSISQKRPTRSACRPLSRLMTRWRAHQIKQLSKERFGKHLQHLLSFDGYKVLQISNIGETQLLTSQVAIDSLIAPISEKKVTKDIIPIPKGYQSSYTMRRAFLSREKRCLLPKHLLSCSTHELRKACHYFQHYYTELENLFCHFSDTPPSCSELNNIMLFLHDPNTLPQGDTFLFDAIASGACMIAPYHKRYIELGFIQNKNCIFYKPGDMQDLINKVSTALKNPKNLAEMARESVAWMHTYFSPKALAQRLDKALEEKLLKTKRKGKRG